MILMFGNHCLLMKEVLYFNILNHIQFKGTLEKFKKDTFMRSALIYPLWYFVLTFGLFVVTFLFNLNANNSIIVKQFPGHWDLPVCFAFA
jgi:hypothetical protein